MCRPGWRRARVQAQYLAELARLRRVRDRIDREYARPLDVVALARDAGVPAGHLGRLFRAAYGRSPHGYLLTRRIERATALLRRGDLGVAEVALAVGCTSLPAFTARFTGLVGVSPALFRLNAAHTAEGGTAGTAADPGHAPGGGPAAVARRAAIPVRNREALRAAGSVA
ncbi:helix-turn-helix transcriptional regulator [Streptomyces rubrolavendulae]|uniref:HTH-type transcriptional regulator CdhR n=1 Tax=Streptomyces rubrolavendulae TaxID=285473 RepID=A0A1D8GAP3_9ACTN|nr:AraC family transcriptional regulator [Streptomyces rubrolavendulae]AOT62512.1 HTH-type transcriptional regulator CdhR [Streptomyces rubrolavendulae]